MAFCEWQHRRRERSLAAPKGLHLELALLVGRLALDDEAGLELDLAVL